jgi:hypothetical protein
MKTLTVKVLRTVFDGRRGSERASRQATMAPAIVSRNFQFLAPYDLQFVRLAALAERYFRSDPNTSLIKLRQFGELLAQEIAARVGLFTPRTSRRRIFCAG